MARACCGHLRAAARDGGPRGQAHTTAVLGGVAPAVARARASQGRALESREGEDGQGALVLASGTNDSAPGAAEHTAEGQSHVDAMERDGPEADGSEGDVRQNAKGAEEANTEFDNRTPGRIVRGYMDADAADDNTVEAETSEPDVP